MAERIDAHHHLWQYDPVRYGWIDDRMAALRRDYLISDFEQELKSAGIAGSIVVQAQQSLDETEWLLSVAESESLLGVVGWAPIASPDFPGVLQRLSGHKKLKGLRHIIQDETDDRFILQPDFNRGITEMKKSGLVYEILIYERHLPYAIEFVHRHPDQVFVVDHIAKPRIREGKMDPWRTQLGELARHENVYCKLSGMVTEADWGTWTTAVLRPYFDVVLDAFGPRRLMAGSDWPVCLLSSYSRWWATVQDFVSQLSEADRDAILGTNAIEVYRLHDSFQRPSRGDALSESTRYQEAR
jgi:L-fuconolactonase